MPDNVAEAIGVYRNTVIASFVLLVIALACAAAYVLARSRAVAGTVPRAEVMASGLSLAFILVSLHLCFMAWWVVPRLVSPGQLTHMDVPTGIKALLVAGRLNALPTFHGGFPYVLLSLGIGMWLAASSESAVGEAGLGRLRAISTLMLLGTIAVAAVSLWAMWSFWGTYQQMLKMVG
jgi:hypothetical protein